MQPLAMAIYTMGLQIKEAEKLQVIFGLQATETSEMFKQLKKAKKKYETLKNISMKDVGLLDASMSRKFRQVTGKTRKSLTEEASGSALQDQVVSHSCAAAPGHGNIMVSNLGSGL